MICGAHESAQGGFFRSILRAVADGCETVQLFTRPPKTWKEHFPTEEDAARFRLAREEAGFDQVVSHASYLVNTCSASEETRARAREALAAEARRCDLLGIEHLVFHPGSPGKTDQEVAIENVALGLRDALARSERVSLLLENTAGQGHSIGWRFEHLAAIIELAGSHPRIGVCFDTCHAFAAGHDVRSPEAAAEVFTELDRVVGAGRLKVIHLNDSRTGLGSRVDRHERLGAGEIGLDLFRWMMNEPRFEGIAGIVETPLDDRETYLTQVKLLRSLRSS